MSSELIDLSSDDDDQCFNWVDYPLELYAATGGLLGNTPLICGGKLPGIQLHGLTQPVDECYSLNGDKSTFVTKMLVKRSSAASIVINETILWVTGGSGGYYNGFLASSEYIRLSGSSPGPDLPMTLYSHAMIAINTTHSMVIGGRNSNWDSIDLTFYFDHGNQQWINGPRLLQARYDHAVGIVNDEVTMTNLVIVTGGSQYSNGFSPYNIDSTEIMVDSQWSLGKKRHALPSYNEINCTPLLLRTGFRIKIEST